jgi:regulator of protease activity HflC (stomatin/prohibitin superfamily)
MLVFLFALLALAGWSLVTAIRTENAQLLLTFFPLLILALISMAGFFVVNPNDARVLVLFGTYKGTVKSNGFFWANPFFSKRKITLRARNLNGERIKVNDATGNPLEIAVVLVWQVTDTAEALFEVDNYEDYVRVQSESAVRGLANQYPYDAHEEGQMSLSTNTQDIADKLKGEIQDRLAKAGVKVLEARISHLAYAPEIAGVMLRRQQASAVIAARQKIVEGAVGMVDMALELLEKSNKVHLDEERKAAMVSNLLVVLCASHDAQPVVNAGTLYQ